MACQTSGRYELGTMIRATDTGYDATMVLTLHLHDITAFHSDKSH